MRIDIRSYPSKLDFMDREYLSELIEDCAVNDKNLEEIIASFISYCNDREKEIKENNKKIKEKNKKITELYKHLYAVVDDVFCLAKESYGVSGLHKNGDESLWGDLLRGGEFECWLKSVNDADDYMKQTNLKEDLKP